MNWIDIGLLVIVILAVLHGFRKGFIMGALDLLSWAGSLVASFFCYPYVAHLIDRVYSMGVWTMPIAFLATLIAARLIFSVIVNALLSTTTEEAHTHSMNRFLGVIPGLVSGVIFAGIVSALLLAFPISDNIAEKTQESRIAPALATQVDWLETELSPVFDEAIKKSMNKLTVNPESSESVNLSYKVTNATVRQDLEAQMLEMINEERRKHGLNGLKPDPEMTIVARKHSRDMFERGYFSHTNPEGKSPFDRMREDGVTFLSAGENLALAKTLSIAHTGLMNSPGHRANILHPSYGRVGIGVLDGGRRGLMITQNFRN
jgi:uncharacterized protein YkwD